jgi:hypothetical protein
LWISVRNVIPIAVQFCDAAYVGLAVSVVARGFRIPYVLTNGPVPRLGEVVPPFQPAGVPWVLAVALENIEMENSLA